MRLACCATTEFQLDGGCCIPGADLDGCVGEDELFFFFACKRQSSLNAISLDGCFQYGLDGVLDPVGQTIAHGIVDFLGLTRGCWNRIAVAQEIGNYFADVIGQIKVFRKAVDDLVDLG